MNIHTQLYQTIQRWVDSIKQIAKPELLIDFSFIFILIINVTIYQLSGVDVMIN